MSKLGSPAYQVTQALNSIFTPSQSRHEGKQRGQAEGHIYGIGTMRNYVEVCVRFARWARDVYGVRDIRELTPDMAGAYIDRLARNERSGGYLAKVKAAIGKLSIALHRQKWDLGGTWHSDRRPERVYSPQEAQVLVADMRAHARDPQVAGVARLQQIAGLRREEAVRLRGVDIDPERCVIRADKGTKGGRPREVRVDPQYRQELQEFKERAERHRDGHVFQGRGSLGQRTERAVEEACKRLGIEDRGTHGLRRTFARERYESYRQAGMDDRQARRELARDLGHNRLDVTYSYVPR